MTIAENKTLSLYDQLEALVLDRNGKIPWKLFDPMPAPEYNRWPFLAVADGLTHALMPAHRTRFWGTTQVACPTMGITECGIYATLKVQDEKLGVYENGVIMPGMLTCLQCLSGVATEGKAMRQIAKEMNFANAYGNPYGKTNQPNMSQLPRGRMSRNLRNMPPRKK